MMLVNGEGVKDRPRIHLEVFQCGWDFWPLFSPHHYLLGAGRMPYGTAFVGFVDGEPVTHVGMAGKSRGRRHEAVGIDKAEREARACRLVVMPEWQGAGLGMRFLNAICQRELDGEGYVAGAKSVLFHTSHPALMAALGRSDRWTRTGTQTHGGTRSASVASLVKSGWGGIGYGGHHRMVTGWRFK